MSLDDVISKSKKDPFRIPKTINEYYKEGMEEVDNPKYFCFKCGMPMYTNIMLSIVKDRDHRQLSGGRQPPKDGYHICTNKECRRYWEELPSIIFEDNRRLENLSEAFIELVKENEKKFAEYDLKIKELGG